MYMEKEPFLFHSYFPMLRNTHGRQNRSLGNARVWSLSVSCLDCVSVVVV